MAYYIDTGRGAFDERDTITEAREVSQAALQSARDFRARMGWTPFWGRCVEIRRGPARLTSPHPGENVNQRIVSKTKTHEVLYLEAVE